MRTKMRRSQVREFAMVIGAFMCLRDARAGSMESVADPLADPSKIQLLAIGNVFTRESAAIAHLALESADRPDGVSAES